MAHLYLLIAMNIAESDSIFSKQFLRSFVPCFCDLDRSFPTVIQDHALTIQVIQDSVVISFPGEPYLLCRLYGLMSKTFCGIFLP